MSNTNMKLPDGFESFVTEEIQPLFDTMQASRAEGFARLKKFGPIGTVVGAALGFWLYTAQPKIWPVSLVLVVAFTVFGMIPGWSKLASARKKFGQAHVGQVAKFLGLTHTPADFEPPRFDTFNQLDLVARGDRRSFSHLVTGTHEGSEFSIYEANIEEQRTRTVTDSKGNTRTETYWVTMFHGQLLHTPYDRKFACTTIIARDQGWFNTKGRFGKTMKPMGLADPKFEKLFEVYTTDQVEGRYLVDPTFMVRLMTLEDNHKNRKTTAAFFEQGVFITLQGGTEFFGKVGKKSTAQGLARETVSAFSHIFDFLDMLKAKAS